MKNNSFLRFFIGALFLFCLTVMPALGQDYYSYSDTWMDDETGFAADPESLEDNVVYIIGSGVAEINSDKIHTLDMQVTITSPKGRSAFENGSWTQDSQGTSLSVTVSLSMDFQAELPDTGEYQTLVQHIPSCPESHTPTGGGSTGYFGVSYPAFEKDFITLNPPVAHCNPRGCWYKRVNPCPVVCPGGSTMFVWGNPQRLGTCMYLIVPWGPAGCSLLTGLRTSTASCVCIETGSN